MLFQQAIVDLIEQDILSFQKTTSIEQEEEARCLEMVTAWRENRCDFDELKSFYEHVKNTRGNFDIEEMLFKSAPQEIFEKLHIPKYATPYRYGPLPIADSESAHALFRLNAGFVNLESLQRCYIDRALSSLYAHLPVGTKRVVIFCYVIADGLGDLIAGLRLTRLLHKELPQLEITLVLIGYVGYLKDKNSYHYLNGEHRWDIPGIDILTLTYEVVDEKPQNVTLSQEVQKVLEEADLAIQTPTQFPQWDEEIEPVLQGVSMTVGEYGFMVSSWCSPKSGSSSMGLHYLEKGIMLNEFDTSQPKPTFENPTFLYLGRTERVSIIFINTILLTYPEGDIDIYVSNPQNIISLIKNLDYEKHGIKEIEVKLGEIDSVEQVSGSGRRLTIIGKQFDETTCISMMQHCNEPIAVRGNQSFSEAIGLERLFFYDSARHNQPFIFEFHQMAETLFPKGSPIIDYTFAMCDRETPAEEVAEKLAKLLKDPQLKCEMIKLCQLIKERHDFRPNFLNMVKRKLANQKYQEREENLVEQFISGRISFTNVIEKMREIL